MARIIPVLSTKPDLRPLTERLGTFTIWGTLVGIIFFGIYPTTNWLSGFRIQHYPLYLDAELQLPFIPEFIWFYLSMYVLFLCPPFFHNPNELRRLAKLLIIETVIAGIVFLALPAQLGFPRTLPVNELYQGIFKNLFIADQPFNLVPSLHVVYTVEIGITLMGRASVPLRVLLSVWLGLIVLSTIFVHQHHVLDVVSGITLVLLMHSPRREKK